MANELKKLDIPLEFNFLGYTDKRNYPNNDFWQIVSKVKNDVVYLSSTAGDLVGESEYIA